jgi:hypothetical protein
MSRREANLLWLKDMLEQLSACRQQLEWAEGPEMAEVLLQTMVRDLERCRRLCLDLQKRSPLLTAA